MTRGGSGGWPSPSRWTFTSYAVTSSPGAPFDAILHVPARAVQLLVQPPGGGFAWREIGHYEPRILPLRQIFRLADHTPLAAPRLSSPVDEVAEPPRRLAGAAMGRVCLVHRSAQRARQTLITRQSQHEADPVVLAPLHQRVAAIARIAPDVDSCVRPVSANLPDNAFELLDAAGRGVLIRFAQPRTQQMLVSGHYEPWLRYGAQCGGGSW